MCLDLSRSYMQHTKIWPVKAILLLLLLLLLVVPSDPLSARFFFSHVLPNVNKVFLSILYTVSTVSVQGGLWAVSTVLPDVNQVLMSVLYTVSTLSVRGGLWVAPVHPLHMPKPVITFVFKVLLNGLLRHVSLASTCTRCRCYAMLTSICHSCLRSHALAVTSCLIFFYVYTWDTRCYAMFTSASQQFKRKKSKKRKSRAKILKSEMLGMLVF